MTAQRFDYRRLFDLSGKTALVTGAAGIIGTEVCHGLAAHGARLAIVDQRSDAAQALAEGIADAHGVDAIAIATDVGDPEQVKAMVETACARLGGIDILHNNAAGKGEDLAAFFSAPEKLPFQTWRDVMRVNLDGMFLVAQAVGRHMIERSRGGSIVQTGSIYGLVAPDPGLYEGSLYLGHRINTPAAYAASKGGVVALSRYLAAYWAPHGIRVNTLVPGGVESGQNDVFQRAYARRTPMGRMARREEMVGAVVYLASDAASYVTGQVLAVDGGWTAW